MKKESKKFLLRITRFVCSFYLYSLSTFVFQNQIAFAVLIFSVIGIYFYTMYAVKQETFLEEIDQEVAEERGEVPPQPKK